MADWQEVKEKYCDRCRKRKDCYTPCPLVNAALFGLPCEEYILSLMKSKGVL